MIKPGAKTCRDCGTSMFNSCCRENHYQRNEHWVENYHCNRCGSHFWKNQWYSKEEWDAYMEESPNG